MKFIAILLGLMLLASGVFAFTACDNAGQDLQTMGNCIIMSGLGGSTDLFALILIGIVIFLAFAARLPGPLCLMLGMGLAYGLDLAFGRSGMLEGLMFLLAIGFVVMIITSFFNLGKIME